MFLSVFQGIDLLNGLLLVRSISLFLLLLGLESPVAGSFWLSTDFVCSFVFFVSGLR